MMNTDENDPQSIRESIQGAFDEADQRELDEELESIEDDESDDESVEEEEEDFDQAAETEEDEAEEEDEPDLEPINPPVSWSAEDKKHFAKLPRQVQEVVLRRETQRDSYLTQKAKEFEQARRFAQPFGEVVSRYQKEWDLQGISPADAVRQAVAMREQLVKDPKQFVKWVAEQGGLDLNEVSQTATKADPHVSRLNGQVQALQAQLAKQVQAAQQQQVVATEQEVVHFAQETDAKGNRLRPHFDQVWRYMIPLTKGIKAANPGASNRQVLDAAYRTVISNTPGLTAAPGKSSNPSKKKAVARAKKAAKSISSKSSASVSEGDPPSLRSALEAAFDRYS